MDLRNATVVKEMESYQSELGLGTTRVYGY
jgi:hypothetical protein